MHIKIPPEFMNIPYDPDRYPQSAKFDFEKGANCQLWAYAILNHFGVQVPPLRSSELWKDEKATETVDDFKPLDILLFNDTDNPWGAHVAVYLGDNIVAHLSQKNGFPEICTVSDMLRRPKYKILIGAKRIKSPNKGTAPETDKRCR